MQLIPFFASLRIGDKMLKIFASIKFNKHKQYYPPDFVFDKPIITNVKYTLYFQVLLSSLSIHTSFFLFFFFLLLFITRFFS